MTGMLTKHLQGDLLVTFVILFQFERLPLLSVQSFALFLSDAAHSFNLACRVV